MDILTSSKNRMMKWLVHGENEWLSREVECQHKCIFKFIKVNEKCQNMVVVQPQGK